MIWMTWMLAMCEQDDCKGYGILLRWPEGAYGDFDLAGRGWGTQESVF